MSSKVIAPGDSGSVKVKFNTKNRVGQNTKAVRIFSNDIKKRIRILRIKANIVRNETTGL